MEQFRAATISSHQGRVAWVDTDAGGRIHYTAAFRWAEIAEHALFRRLRPGFEAAVFPRKSVEAAYHSKLVFDDEFEIRLRAGSIGRTSVTFVWEVHSEGVLCVEGRHTTVHIEANGRPAPLPEWLRAGLEEPAPQDPPPMKGPSTALTDGAPAGSPDQTTKAVT